MGNCGSQRDISHWRPIISKMVRLGYWLIAVGFTPVRFSRAGKFAVIAFLGFATQSQEERT
jgi:hypothetical protein